jgi:methyl-accepting chemotaxis protein
VSLINFAQRLAQLEAAAARTEGKLDQLKNKIDNVKGPMDQLIEQAEQTGSAVGNVNGVIIEAVRMSGEAVPTLQGVMWDMYEITKSVEETEGVSRDILDRLAKRMDETIPQYNLWMKNFLAQAERGQLSLEELAAKIEEWFGMPGVRQMNSMLHGDIDNFLLSLRKMMGEIEEAGDEAIAIGERVEKQAEEIRNTTSGMERAGDSPTGTMGTAPSEGVTASGTIAALQITRGRLK